MVDVIKNNPALAIGIARALVTVLLILGLQLSTEQEAAIVVVVQLAFTLVTAQLTVPKSPTANAPDKSIQENSVP